MKPIGIAALSEILPYWPADIFGQPKALDAIGLRDFEVETSGDEVSIEGKLVWAGEIDIDLPLVQGLSIVLLSGNGFTEVPIEIELLPELVLSVPNIGFGLRFRSNLLRRVVRKDKRWVAVKNADGSDTAAEVRFSGLGFKADLDGNIGFTGTPRGDLLPVQIGDTGVVVEMKGLAPYLSAQQTRPSDVPADFRGVTIDSITVHLPDDLDVPLAPTSIQAQELRIGTGGFSGTLSGQWFPKFNTSTKKYELDGSGTLFGIPFALETLSFKFLQNVPVESALHGELLLPFFDQRVGVDLSIGFDGSISLALSKAQIPPASVTGGLLTFKKPGILEVEVHSLSFELENGLFVAKLSGKIKPLIAGINRPAFDVRELAIDSEGNVRLDGGWLNLPNQYALDFHGFKIEITQLGFGKTDDGGKWIGFSGGVHLVKGLPQGGSVEGLRIAWYPNGDTKISLDGVGIDFFVPKVLEFHGHVAYRELPGGVHRFDGRIKLDVISLKMKLDATLVIGIQGGEHYFAIFVDAQLPAGIPLFAGISMYGMAGLFAMEMAPNKKPLEAWYEGPDGSDGWYKRPDPGVSDITKKWDAKSGAKAFGAGITIGTNDNGFTFSTKALFVIVFPGPILLIDGRGNLLKERAELDGADPLFRAFAVLDGEAGTLLIALDAHYKYGFLTGRLLDIRGGAEAFFDFDDGDAWHIHLGVDTPRERRIRARILSLFEASAYLMLDSTRVATGAWIGYDKKWKFGPLSITLQAWLEGNARLSWSPAYFHGDVWLHGSAALKIFGFGLGMTVDATLAADVFDPFHLRAEFSVSISLPWPLDDFEADVTLEWGPDAGVPEVAVPLKEVAIEHFKVTTSWQLAITGAALTAPPANIPRVPVDSRPRITFARSVHDDCGVGGINAQAPWPYSSPEGWEWIGDPSRGQGPARARYSLDEVILEKWTGSWSPVARAGKTTNKTGVAQLYGSWAPVPQLPSGHPAGGSPAVANDKLWLWSRTPFDYTRHNSDSTYDDWFTSTHPDYPCLPPVQEHEVCVDFSRHVVGTALASVNCGTATIQFSRPGIVTALDEPVKGFTRALCFEQREPNPTAGTVGTGPLVLHLDKPATKVRLVFANDEEITPRPVIDFRNRTPTQLPNPLFEQGVLFERFDIDGVRTEDTPIVDSGLAGGARLDISLPARGNAVELSLSASAESPAEVTALRADGSIASRTTATENIRLDGDVTRVFITSRGGDLVLHEFRYGTSGAPRPTATTRGRCGEIIGPFTAVDHTIEVNGDAVNDVTISGTGPLCLVQVCVTLPPDPAEVAKRNELTKRMKDSLAHWHDEGEVLDPHSAYRLVIATTAQRIGLAPKPFLHTDYVYFRTDGPPGLGNFSIPSGLPDVEQVTLKDKDDKLVRIDGTPSTTPVLMTKLSTLEPYVRQTIPPTVTGPGEKPVLPRPVYRAYDVSVDFNESYVDLMYRNTGRDLGLYLYDANDRPLRDASGALVIPQARWRPAETLTLTEGERRWIATLKNSKCGVDLAVDTASIPHTVTLVHATGPVVLDADTIHEARLLPLLMHDEFQWPGSASGTDATAGRWSVHDDPTSPGGASKWVIGSARAAQTTIVRTYLLRTADPSLDATHPEQPANWTDYRFSTVVLATDPRLLAVVFRWRDPANFYAFAMDATVPARVLVRVAGGAITVLAQDGGTFELGREYVVIAEALETRLRVLVDGVLAFDVTDATHATGTVGFYCGGNPGASFADARVQDFRSSAIPAYRFRFLTSRFTNFFHHLQSFNDETWPVTLPATASIDGPLGKAVALTVAANEDEARAYAALAAEIFGADAERTTTRVEIERVARGTDTLLFHVRTAEPIDWTRTDVALAHSSLSLGQTVLPGAVKLTAATNDSVTLLMREAADIGGWRIDMRAAGTSDAWQTWHTFAAKESHPVGKRLVVTGAAFSGAVDLTLVSSAGDTVHSRRFLGDSDSVAVTDARLLRRRDGTMFFLTTAARPLAAGAYRLTLTFRRGDGVLPLSENGDRTAETVVLDLAL